MKCQKKKLFCAFIDFTAAFDTVWRDGCGTNFELTKLMVNGII
jgi:hypothetical protein